MPKTTKLFFTRYLADYTITAYAMLAPTNLTGKSIKAQVIHSNGNSFNYKLTSDKEETFAAGKAYTLTGTTITDREYVDLGLPGGTLWATCNIGASSPDQYGYYFAWGEVDPKETYSWVNYKFGTSTALTKYCTNSENGTVDNKTVLDPGDDAATVNWGPDWCMPTQQKMKDLLNGEYTTNEWTTQNGVNGLKITSKKYSDRSIFLPAGGWKSNSGPTRTGETGRYWSSNLRDSECTLATYLFFDNQVPDPALTTINRFLGHSIRPVRRVSVENEYVDLGLPSGTLWATCNIGASSPEDYGYYFAWGEVVTKETYSWGNYKFGASTALSKYCTDSQYGTVDNKTVLYPGDDAATANWGPDWCMPTKEQMNELINTAYTTQEWTTLNGINGLKITSKQNSDRSIFLPAGGWKSDSGPKSTGETGRYWSSNLSDSYCPYATYLAIDDNYSEPTPINRFLGHSVRAVRQK